MIKVDCLQALEKCQLGQVVRDKEEKLDSIGLSRNSYFLLIADLLFQQGKELKIVQKKQRFSSCILYRGTLIKDPQTPSYVANFTIGKEFDQEAPLCLPSLFCASGGLWFHLKYIYTLSATSLPIWYASSCWVMSRYSE